MLSFGPTSTPNMDANVTKCPLASSSNHAWTLLTMFYIQCDEIAGLIQFIHRESKPVIEVSIYPLKYKRRSELPERNSIIGRILSPTNFETAMCSYCLRFFFRYIPD